MIRLIRYIVYLFVILACLFMLKKSGFDARAGLDTIGSRLKAFAVSIKQAPSGDHDGIYKDISKQDFTGGLGGTSTATTVKAYENSVVKKNPIEPAELTVEGIIRYTNIERKKAGLQPLVVQKKLSASALKKANDMLDRQYFEHTSPDGKTAVNLVKEKGYAFQIVGENLALGDFGSDKKLVDAWMNSPAHKENILNPKFTEIGIGIVKGDYQGANAWLAVQHFGKPLPVCLAVNQENKNAIDSEKFKLEGEERELQLMAAEIEADPEQNKGQEFLEAYNLRVGLYNIRLEALRQKIRQYNIEVTAYNSCLGVHDTTNETVVPIKTIDTN